EIELIPRHFPLRLTGARRLWCGHLSARTRLWRGRGCGRLRTRCDPASILDSAIDVACAFHVETKVEVRDVSALPHDVDRACWMFAGWIDVDGAVFHRPELRIAIPAFECFPIEKGGEAFVMVEVLRR